MKLCNCVSSEIEYLGHSSVNITLDLYTHVTEEKSSIDIEKIVDCMDNNIVDFTRKIS